MNATSSSFVDGSAVNSIPDLTHEQKQMVVLVWLTLVTFVRQPVTFVIFQVLWTLHTHIEPWPLDLDMLLESPRHWVLLALLWIVAMQVHWKVRYQLVPVIVDFCHDKGPELAHNINVQYERWLWNLCEYLFEDLWPSCLSQWERLVRFFASSLRSGASFVIGAANGWWQRTWTRAVTGCGRAVVVARQGVVDLLHRHGDILRSAQDFMIGCLIAVIVFLLAVHVELAVVWAIDTCYNDAVMKERLESVIVAVVARLFPDNDIRGMDPSNYKVQVFVLLPVTAVVITGLYLAVDAVQAVVNASTVQQALHKLRRAMGSAAHCCSAAVSRWWTALSSSVAGTVSRRFAFKASERKVPASDTTTTAKKGKHVRFRDGPDDTRLISTLVDVEHKKEVWYTKSELKQMRADGRLDRIELQIAANASYAAAAASANKYSKYMYLINWWPACVVSNCLSRALSSSTKAKKMCTRPPLTRKSAVAVGSNTVAATSVKPPLPTPLLSPAAMPVASPPKPSPSCLKRHKNFVLRSVQSLHVFEVNKKLTKTVRFAEMKTVHAFQRHDRQDKSLHWYPNVHFKDMREQVRYEAMERRAQQVEESSHPRPVAAPMSSSFGPQHNSVTTRRRYSRWALMACALVVTLTCARRSDYVNDVTLKAATSLAATVDRRYRNVKYMNRGFAESFTSSYATVLDVVPRQASRLTEFAESKIASSAHQVKTVIENVASTAKSSYASALEVVFETVPRHVSQLVASARLLVSHIETAVRDIAASSLTAHEVKANDTSAVTPHAAELVAGIGSLTNTTLEQDSTSAPSQQGFNADSFASPPVPTSEETEIEAVPASITCTSSLTVQDVDSASSTSHKNVTDSVHFLLASTEPPTAGMDQPEGPPASETSNLTAHTDPRRSMRVEDAVSNPVNSSLLLNLSVASSKVDSSLLLNSSEASSRVSSSQVMNASAFSNPVSNSHELNSSSAVTDSQLQASIGSFNSTSTSSSPKSSKLTSLEDSPRSTNHGTNTSSNLIGTSPPQGNVNSLAAVGPPPPHSPPSHSTPASKLDVPAASDRRSFAFSTFQTWSDQVTSNVQVQRALVVITTTPLLHVPGVNDLRPLSLFDMKDVVQRSLETVSDGSSPTMAFSSSMASACRRWLGAVR